MEEMMSGIEVIPSAKRLIGSLRNMGYDFSQAVADIVDNSIEAKATIIAIDVEFDGDDSWVRVADNGVGMSPEQLREAMRYGSDRKYEVDDLGKYGLGLKTASLSQCQILSVASRNNPKRAAISAYSWDCRHIERTNRWEILPLDRNGLGPAIMTPLKETTGTVVLWSRLDRILGYSQPYGEFARKRLSQMCRELESHLGMVFHRFLSGELKGKKIKILLNGNDVKPWDPFCRKEEKTKSLQQLLLNVDYEGTSGRVLIHPFILPHQSDFSSQDAFRLATGPANWNQQQGFYIYRAGRMIQSGGWSNLRTADEHTKLARVSISFSPSLDDAFKVNVAKMRAQIPPSIREELQNAISTVAKMARTIYDRKETRSRGTVPTTASTTNTPRLLPSSSPGAVTDPPLQSLVPGNAGIPVLLTFQQWSQMLLAVATEDEKAKLSEILGRILVQT